MIVTDHTDLQQHMEEQYGRKVEVDCWICTDDDKVVVVLWQIDNSNKVEIVGS